MKLQIHIGTEKTGSSYLQKLCGRNRQYLKDCGIWFPDAGKHEKRLQEGTISSGNAAQLTEHIRDSDWPEVSNWIMTRADEAEKCGCSILLLSNELLFAAMSKVGALAQVQIAAEQAGISESTFLLVIRDPIEQALSLYKHRAKNGTISNVQEWLQYGYSLPRDLQGFLGEAEESNISLHLRKYKKQSGSIEQLFFHDWLEIDTPPNRIENIVNPSLTLSELEVIRHIASTRPEHRSAFYSSFLAIPREKKARDGALDDSVTAEIERRLCEFNSLWEQLDRQLEADGGLKVPQNRPTEDAGDPQYVFSEAQIDGWIKGHSESSSLLYSAKYWVRSRLRPFIGKIIRKVIPGFRRG